jgi:hypothetical protein
MPLLKHWLLIFPTPTLRSMTATLLAGKTPGTRDGTQAHTFVEEQYTGKRIVSITS